jgi:hypothetical protein
MRYNCLDFAQDVLTYFQSNREWKENEDGEDFLTDEHDQDLYCRAEKVANAIPNCPKLGCIDDPELDDDAEIAFDIEMGAATDNDSSRPRKC